MSTMSQTARIGAQSKLDRMLRNDPKMKVDASDYTPPGPMDADVQTGPRPISRRQYKRGGKILGEELKRRADRKPRATGGRALVDAYQNRDMKEANPGGHRGGYARGGHAEGCACAKCMGGRAERAEGGGNWIAGAIHHPGRLHRITHTPAGQKIPEKKIVKAEHSSDNSVAAAARLGARLKAMHKKGGGSVSNPSYDGTRPVGGRMARASGGRSKKGMNVNIIIAQQPTKPPMSVPPPGMAPGPVGMHQGAPPPMPPGAAAPPPMGAGAPPPVMPRRSGGRAYPIKDGAGGGEGRLQKIKAYG